MSLKSILAEYFDYQELHADTMLPRFFGLHHIRINGVKVRFVVMQNVFYTHLEIHEKYDLKGSTQGRCLTTEEKGDPNVKLISRRNDVHLFSLPLLILFSGVDAPHHLAYSINHFVDSNVDVTFMFSCYHQRNCHFHVIMLSSTQL